MSDNRAPTILDRLSWLQSAARRIRDLGLDAACCGKETAALAELDMLAHVVEENAMALLAAANRLDVHEQPAPIVWGPRD